MIIIIKIPINFFAPIKNDDCSMKLSPFKFLLNKVSNSPIYFEVMNLQKNDKRHINAKK